MIALYCFVYVDVRKMFDRIEIKNDREDHKKRGTLAVGFRI